MTIKTEFGNYENAYLRTNRYLADGSLYIQAWNPADGPIATITVCLDDKSLNENMAYVDTNNCPWALDFIREYGLGKEAGFYMMSGYCMYPAVEFDIDAVQSYRYQEAAS